MRLLPRSIHRCHRYPTKFNSGRDFPFDEGGRCKRLFGQARTVRSQCRARHEIGLQDGPSLGIRHVIPVSIRDLFPILKKEGEPSKE